MRSFEFCFSPKGCSGKSPGHARGNLLSWKAFGWAGRQSHPYLIALQGNACWRLGKAKAWLFLVVARTLIATRYSLLATRYSLLATLCGSGALAAIEWHCLWLSPRGRASYKILPNPEPRTPNPEPRTPNHLLPLRLPLCLSKEAIGLPLYKSCVIKLLIFIDYFLLV